MEKVNWFDKNKEIIAIIITVISGFFWLTNKFDHFNDRFAQIDKEIVLMKKDMEIIKAFMIMKNILPQELAKEKENEHKK